MVVLSYRQNILSILMRTGLNCSCNVIAFIRGETLANDRVYPAKKPDE